MENLILEGNTETRQKKKLGTKPSFKQTGLWLMLPEWDPNTIPSERWNHKTRFEDPEVTCTLKQLLKCLAFYIPSSFKKDLWRSLLEKSIRYFTK